MNKPLTGLERQREIYLGGVAGEKPSIPIDPEALEKAAKDRLSLEAYAYIAGGAGVERTMHNNRTAFDAWQVVPRMLRNVAERDLSIQLLGRKYSSPFLLAPIGVLEMAHKEADLAVARAAAKHQIPYIFSNQASTPMEEVAAEMGDAPRWFQLYWSKNNDLVASLVSRAERIGCEAIVVTLDTTLLGWRVNDLDQAYLPFLRGKGIAQYTSDPVFQQMLNSEPQGPAQDAKRKINLSSLQTLAQMASHYPGKALTALRSGKAIRAVQHFINVYTNPALSWEDLAFLRSHTKLPILLKGILHPEDAKLAIQHGVDGIMVSNHGGRQVDGAVGALTMLPEIVDAVQDQIPVLFDSGIRTGADAFKALALGAKAVAIGRPYVYGLTLGGQAGVEEVLKNFLGDLDLTLGLSGCKSLNTLNRDYLRTK
ncbi:MAG TPA: lactate 2-monooxygenase [Cytophagales bacterium]|nr:lactate 2-monooxygenase [Cytophagales bacterium]HAP64677.1 lactate 2-monooxygenase [Cytophagales bacterium]